MLKNVLLDPSQNNHRCIMGETFPGTAVGGILFGFCRMGSQVTIFRGWGGGGLGLRQDHWTVCAWDTRVVPILCLQQTSAVYEETPGMGGA